MRKLACRGLLSSQFNSRAYPVLASVSRCYSKHEGRLSTRYSPVRHSTHVRRHFRVRLACVKHAASVQSEPESNSPVQICIKISALAEIRISKFFPTRYSLVNEQPPTAFRQREKALSTFSPALSTTFFSSAKLFSLKPKWSPTRGKALCAFYPHSVNRFLQKFRFFLAICQIHSLFETKPRPFFRSYTPNGQRPYRPTRANSPHSPPATAHP